MAAYQATPTATAAICPTVVITYYSTGPTTSSATDVWAEVWPRTMGTVAANEPVFEPALAPWPRRRSKRAQLAILAPPAPPIALGGRAIAACPRPLCRRWGREARHPLTRSPFQGDRCAPGPSATT